MTSSPSLSSSTAHIGLMAPLTSAVVELRERDLDWRASGELTQILDATSGLQSQLDSLMAMAVVAGTRAAVHKQQKYKYRNIAQMVADRTGADPARVRRLGRLGEWVDEFSDFNEAWADGLLLTEHIDMIRKVADNSRTHSALLRDQQLFIEWACDYDFHDYTECCGAWVNANDPDGEIPKEQTAKTYFRARKHADGSVKLDGYLDPLSGAAFMTALNQETQKLFRAKQDSDSPLQLDLGKQGADALMNLIVRGHKNTNGTETTPLINIVMSQSVAADLLDRMRRPVGESSTPFPIAFDDIDGRCELIDGTQLHPHFAMQALATADFQRHIMDAKGRILDSSVNSRFFSEAQKHALRVQARGRCRKRGCDAPFPWLEADHRVARSRGGLTEMANGQMLCRPDNLAKGDSEAA